MTLGDAGITSALAGRPLLAVYVAGVVVALAVLLGIALTRPRTFTAVLDGMCVTHRVDRWTLLGALVVVWAAGWPATAMVLAARAIRRRRR